MSQSQAHMTPRGRELASAHKGVYFGALDGFRGLLALLVAIFHTGWLSKFNNTDFLNQGAVIIDLFFVFSGFLMFSLYGQKLNTGLKAKKFLWRRFARLYPVHLFMTLVFLAFALIRLFAHKIGIATTEMGEVLPFHSGSHETFFTLFSNLTLTQAMGLNDSLTFNPPAWTISVEFFAYFIFAAMLLWLPPKKQSHFAVITALVAAIYIWLSRIKPDMDITYDYAFWRCLAGFYTGVIGAEIYRRLSARSARKIVKPSMATHILEIFTLVAFVGFVIYLPGKMQFFVAPFALLFVTVFAFDRGFISKLMMARPFAFLARISYSVYMVHVIIAIMADIFAEKFLSRLFGERWHDAGFNGDIYLIPYLIVVIIAGYLLQRFVEAPSAKWLGKMDITGRAKFVKSES